MAFVSYYETTYFYYHRLQIRLEHYAKNRSSFG